jgi:hypothetical protein
VSLKSALDLKSVLEGEFEKNAPTWWSLQQHFVSARDLHSSAWVLLDAWLVRIHLSSSTCSQFVYYITRFDHDDLYAFVFEFGRKKHCATA